MKEEKAGFFPLFKSHCQGSIFEALVIGAEIGQDIFE
jgi:hypothetical protein